MKKEITLEDLAGMVNNGFESLRSDMNKRFDKVENRLDTVEQEVKDVRLSIDTQTYKFDIKDLDNRVTKLEKKLA